MLEVKIHQCLDSIPMSKFDKFDPPSASQLYNRPFDSVHVRICCYQSSVTVIVRIQSPTWQRPLDYITLYIYILSLFYLTPLTHC